MLQALAFKTDFRTFRKGRLIHFFDPVTILVGDQGAGKSTLIEIIRALATPPAIQEKLWQSVQISQAKANTIAIPFSDTGGFRLWARDFERDGTRFQASIIPDEQGGLKHQLAAMEMSHGQANRAILESLDRVNLGAPTLFVLDEPDGALSPRSCYDLVRLLRKLAAAGHQVIASAHNPIVIMGRIPEDPTSGWKQVHNLETLTFPTPEAYLEAQSRPKPTPTSLAR